VERGISYYFSLANVAMTYVQDGLMLDSGRLASLRG